MSRHWYQGQKLLPTLQLKSHLCILFLGSAWPQSQFSHSCICERFIYSQDPSTYFLQQNRQIDHGNIQIPHRHMNVQIGTVVAQFLFWEFVSHFFGIGSLQGRAGFTTNAYTNDSSVFRLNFRILEPCQCLEGLTVRVQSLGCRYLKGLTTGDETVWLSMLRGSILHLMIRQSGCQCSKRLNDSAKIVRLPVHGTSDLITDAQDFSLSWNVWSIWLP